MCGIVASVAQKPVWEGLVQALGHLEYRGYDSAGMALLDQHQQLHITKTPGKVVKLKEAIQASASDETLQATVGIAHTRWATHGEPNQMNAHPQTSGPIAVVHNGIIENFRALQADLIEQGYTFISETDTEVIAHALHAQSRVCDSFETAIAQVVDQLEGVYAFLAIHADSPGKLFAVCQGSPLVVGRQQTADDMHYQIASDPLAFQGVKEYALLEVGACISVSLEGVSGDALVWQPMEAQHSDNTLGNYPHYMLKEIEEQPDSLQRLIHSLWPADGGVAYTQGWLKGLTGIGYVHMVACGSSYYAAQVARYWIEEHVGLPCSVEVASEYRYRAVAVPKHCLFLTLSQSGETADTLAALRHAKQLPYQTYVAICNVEQSTLVREVDHTVFLKAGAEIGVASTKAFTAQLVALMALTDLLAQACADKSIALEEALHALPHYLRKILKQTGRVKALAQTITQKQSTLFVARGDYYPLAMEGALKLKEISYIHASAYPAGELKHGPIALVDDQLPIIALLPQDERLQKTLSNCHEIEARSGFLIIFHDQTVDLEELKTEHSLAVPGGNRWCSPIGFVVLLQLLAYHVSVLKGLPVDQPRNLAKSVTVE